MAYATNPTVTLAEFEKYCNSDVNYEFHKPNPDAAITMMTGSADEMIRVTKEGFWVRGVRVPQDDKEAETVYNAFKQWMAWAALTQQR